MVGFIVCLLAIDIPAEALIGFFLFFLSQCISIEIKLVFIETFSLDFFLSLLPFLEPLVLFHHLMVIDIVFPDFFVECSLVVGYLSLIYLQF
jgi:hypothetical protein